MSRADVSIKDQAYHSVPTYTWQHEAASTAVVAGELTKVKVAGSKYAIVAADGDGVIGTTLAMLGIVKRDSNSTASADGDVEIYVPLPGIVYAAKAKTATAADTQSEIDALRGKRVVWDVTSSVHTVDTAAADNANNAFVITGGDFNNSAIYFMIRPNITLLGNTL